MIFHRSYDRQRDQFLIVCGSFWPGAKDGAPPPEHLVLTGQVVCDGPKCACHELRERAGRIGGGE
jgi:hypothetical protein